MILNTNLIIYRDAEASSGMGKDDNNNYTDFFSKLVSEYFGIRNYFF